MNIGVIGAGSWGSAFADYLSRQGHHVMVYGRDHQLMEQINQTHVNPKYLADVRLDEQLFFTSNLDMVTSNKDLLVNALSAQQVSGFYSANRAAFQTMTPIVNLSKGIEIGTLRMMHQIFSDLFPGWPYATLSGPSHAEEVSKHMPTTLVVASADSTLCHTVQSVSSNTLRIYRSDDVIGVELGGSLKNIIAVVVGISDGLGFGDNTRAAIMTRGMSEIMQLALVLGAREKTFLGLSGFGDLIVTCTSKHSRNRNCGELIGKGYPVKEAMQKIGMVVEGIYTMESTYELSQKLGIDMPLTSALHAMINEHKTVYQVLLDLMGRDFKDEFDDL